MYDQLSKSMFISSGRCLLFAANLWIIASSKKLSIVSLKIWLIAKVSAIVLHVQILLQFTSAPPRLLVYGD